MDRGGISAEGNLTAKGFWAGVNAVIYRICHHRRASYKFPDCSNSDNEVTNCTVSSQHFGVQTQHWKRLLLWIIRRRHHSSNITLMQPSVWLWASLRLLTARWARKLGLEQRGKVITQNLSWIPPMIWTHHLHHHHYPCNHHHHHNRYVNMLSTFRSLDPGQRSRPRPASACAYFSVFWGCRCSN